MMEVKDLSAWYGGKSIFEKISFVLKDGSFTALCGKNGSGKSTLLSLMAGIVPDGLKYSGEILIDGKSVFKLRREDAAKTVSLLLQSESPAWNFTVRQFVETGLYAFGRMPQNECDAAVDQALEKIGMEDFASKKICNISGGEFQKCRLARSFVQKTGTMLFDEPAEKLDLPFQMKFLQEIKCIDKTVLFSIHDLNSASFFAEDFLLLSKGTLIQADRKTVFTPEVLSQAFDAQAEIFEHPVKKVPQVFFS
ncbi:MAG: ABC transporter ATP-binding protein [Treponema sp.]|nr:ABC transporter ATP-binding protein [Treponema sp.]